VALSGGETPAHGITPGIPHGVDLGAQSAAGTPPGLRTLFWGHRPPVGGRAPAC
jgi:hypothetical protein